MLQSHSKLTTTSVVINLESKPGEFSDAGSSLSICVNPHSGEKRKLTPADANSLFAGGKHVLASERKRVRGRYNQLSSANACRTNLKKRSTQKKRIFFGVEVSSIPLGTLRQQSQTVPAKHSSKKRISHSFNKLNFPLSVPLPSAAGDDGAVGHISRRSLRRCSILAFSASAQRKENSLNPLLKLCGARWSAEDAASLLLVPTS